MGRRFFLPLKTSFGAPFPLTFFSAGVTFPIPYIQPVVTHLFCRNESLQQFFSLFFLSPPSLLCGKKSPTLHLVYSTFNHRLAGFALRPLVSFLSFLVNRSIFLMYLTFPSRPGRRPFRLCLQLALVMFFSSPSHRYAGTSRRRTACPPP